MQLWFNLTLFQVHFFIEPFCVCLKRTLPPRHPLQQILKFHCREVTVPNTLGTPALTTEIGFVASLFAYGAEGANRLVRDGQQFATWDVTDYRNNIKVQLALQHIAAKLWIYRGTYRIYSLYISYSWPFVREKCLILKRLHVWQQWKVPLIIPAYPIEQNQTKKSIEPNRTPIVRVGSVIEQNRTSVLLWVRFSNQSNTIERNGTW